jgi:hypothetical protein
MVMDAVVERCVVNATRNFLISAEVNFPTLGSGESTRQ